jgi:hypothetical protein
MSTLVAYWLDPTALLARCSLHRHRRRHRLRAYELLPASEGLHLATAEQPLARSLSALWTLWRRVALTDPSWMAMEFLMLMDRVQTSVVDDVRWSMGEAPLLLLLGACLRRHPER